MFKRLSWLTVLFWMVLAGPVSAALVDGESLRDPTLPPGKMATTGKGAAVQSYRLSSVLVADDRRQAIVNGKTVRVGSGVDGARVIAIDADRVVLSVAGKSRVLRWKTGAAVRRSPVSEGKR